MFQRLSRHYEGTGIGLVLVRKVMQRMDARNGAGGDDAADGLCYLVATKSRPVALRKLRGI